MKYIILCLFSLLFIPIASISQPGTLDPTFGLEGKVITHLDDGYLYCYAGALQNDGKIIAGGRLQETDTSFNGFVLIRYNTDGSLDETFGNKGQVRTLFDKINGDIHSLIVKPNGQILALGYGFKENPNLPDNYNGVDADILLSCYNESGTLDSSFGTNGETITDFGKDEIVNAMTLQPDGKVLIAGYSRNGYQGSKQMLTVRYTADGKIDETFGKGGSVIYHYIGNEGACVAVDDEGRIIVGGTYHFPDRFLVVRYLQDGTIDATFGNEGAAITTMDAGPVAVNSVLVLKDGNILAAGVGSDNMMAVRYTKDGRIENTFGKQGRMSIAFAAGSSHVQSALQQPDGKIILAGGTGISQFYPSDFALASLLPDGTMDKEFSDSGKVVTDFGQYETAFTALLQQDGKVVLVGHSLQYFSLPTINDFVLARYNTAQSVLPIALTNFTAMQNERGVVLNWQTAQETNTNYFFVQRSLSNSPYAEIAKVKSIGYSTIPHNYTYVDNAPITGANTYELKEVDKDGRASYSRAAFVNYSIGKTLKLYPNPAHNMVIIEGLNAGVNTTISLLGINGKVIKQQVSTGSNKSMVNTTPLVAGVYYFKVDAGNNTTTIRFVKE